MPKFDDEQISFLGGESVAWPEPGTSDVWRTMHRAVDAIRTTVRQADAPLARLEDNRDLTEEGRGRQMFEAGLTAILSVDDHITLKAARTKAEARAAALDAEMQAHAVPPEDPADIALASEIRSALRGMAPAERIRFIRENLHQPGLAGAVSSGAGFLSGLSATEQAEVRTMVSEALYAPQTAEKAMLARGLRELEMAQKRAHDLVARRSRMERNHHGEWAPRRVNLPVGATPSGAYGIPNVSNGR